MVNLECFADQVSGIRPQRGASFGSKAARCSFIRRSVEPFYSTENSEEPYISAGMQLEWVPDGLAIVGLGIRNDVIHEDDNMM
jgi:hypothetical protein